MDPVSIGVLAWLQTQYPHHLAGLLLYGSRARGTAKPTSDYDFVALFHNAPTEQMRMALAKGKLDHLSPTSVDVFPVSISQYIAHMGAFDLADQSLETGVWVWHHKVADAATYDYTAPFSDFDILLDPKKPIETMVNKFRNCAILLTGRWNTAIERIVLRGDTAHCQLSYTDSVLVKLLMAYKTHGLGFEIEQALITHFTKRLWENGFYLPPLLAWLRLRENCNPNKLVA